MTFQMATFLLHITALSYYSYLVWIYQIKMSLYKVNKSNIIIWLFMCFIKFGAINLMCESVCIKVNLFSFNDKFV